MTTSLDPAPPPTTAAPRHRWRDAALLGGALPFVLVALARSTAFAEGDTYWQITTGAEVLARRTTALVEDDSWNAAGTPWHPNSWGYDVLVDLAWRLGGWAGLGWFTVLTVSLVGVAVVVVGRRLGAAAPALAVVSTLAVVPLTAWLSARPQTVSYAALVLLVGLAARVLLGTGRRSALLGAAGLVGLTALWVNLHLAALGGFAAVAGGVGLAVLAGPVRTAVRERRWRDVAGQLVRPAVVVGAVGLGCLASPLGTGIVAAAGHTADESTALIDEWAPLWRAKPVLAMTWVAAALCLAVLVLAGGGTWLALRGTGSGTAAAPTTTTATTTTDAPPPAVAPPTTAEQTTSAPPTTTEAPTTEPDVVTAAEVSQFVTDYYALLPDDPDSAYGLTGPTLQGVSSRGNYKSFWKRFDEVVLGPVSATDGSLVATAQVTFVEDDEEQVEQHQFTLVEGPDGTLLMDRDIPL
ncbi:hypothetical protein GCM10023162_01310 [Klenkia terrae]